MYIQVGVHIDNALHCVYILYMYNMTEFVYLYIVRDPVSLTLPPPPPGSTEGSCEGCFSLPDVSLPLFPRSLQHALPLAHCARAPVHRHRGDPRLQRRNPVGADLHQFCTLRDLQLLHQLWHRLHLPTLHLPRHCARHSRQWCRGHAAAQGGPVLDVEVHGHGPDCGRVSADVAPAE